ncbi:MAG: BatA domain-containing protein [Flavobacteriales bacterium]|nr:BatA domain-containing protein [Flavobacteriales bacterium]
MSFLHPAFLWALAALAIPVLIHLFQLRRFKRIDFTHTRFLAEVTKQTRARRKVQHWLTLLARMLALAFLVFAFAQPYIPGEDSSATAGDRAISLYIDDSWSMDGQNAQGRLLDQARRGAQEAIMAHAATDRFQVITGRFEGREQMLLGLDDAMEAASRVDVGPFARPLSQVMTRQREALATSEAETRRAFLFTDLQRGITDVEHWTDDPAIPTVIVPLPPTRPDNLSIDSVWFETPVRRAWQGEALRVRIRNHGAQDLVNVPLRLSLAGQQRAIATFSVEASATVDTVLRFSGDGPGLVHGEVSISDQPVTFDDRMHISYRVTDRLRVAVVSGGDQAGDRALAAVFEGDSTHVFTTVAHRMVDLAALQNQDLVVLQAVPDVPGGLLEALAAFVEQGGSLAVFPPSQGDPAGHAGLFGRFGAAPPTRLDTGTVRVDRIDLEQPFYRDVFQTMPRNVDLPVARERWSLTPKPGSDILLRAQDGRPYLSRTPIGLGAVYLSAVPLAERAGNLVRHALFATSLLRMAELARPMGALYHSIGEEVLVPMEGLDLPGERPPTVSGPEGTAFTPEVRRTPGGTALAFHDQDMRPGPYTVMDGGDTLAVFALNLSRRESDLATLDPADLRALLTEKGLTTFSVLETGTGDLSLRLTELGQAPKLWKWCILLALLFLAAEVFLLRASR